MTGDDPNLERTACLQRTRSMVLNVLIAIGVGIAVSGWLLRARDRFALIGAPRPTGPALLLALAAVAAASHVSRRLMCGRRSLTDPATRYDRFYRGRVVSAGIGLLALPLGLAYGWFVRPTLEGVAPFWVAALAMGFLSLPRAAELEDFDAMDILAPVPDESPQEPTEPIIS